MLTFRWFVPGVGWHFIQTVQLHNCSNSSHAVGGFAESGKDNLSYAVSALFMHRSVYLCPIIQMSLGHGTRLPSKVAIDPTPPTPLRCRALWPSWALLVFAPTRKEAPYHFSDDLSNRAVCPLIFVITQAVWGTYRISISTRA